MHKLVKQPDEVLVGVAIDYVNRLTPGATILNGTVTALCIDGTEGAGNDLTINDVDSNGTILGATISKGYNNCTYKLSYLGTGSDGNVLASEIRLTIKNL